MAPAEQRGSDGHFQSPARHTDGVHGGYDEGRYGQPPIAGGSNDDDDENDGAVIQSTGLAFRKDRRRGGAVELVDTKA